MQRNTSGFRAKYMKHKSRTHTVKSSPAVTDSVFMTGVRLLIIIIIIIMCLDFKYLGLKGDG